MFYSITFVSRLYSIVSFYCTLSAFLAIFYCTVLLVCNHYLQPLSLSGSKESFSYGLTVVILVSINKRRADTFESQVLQELKHFCANKLKRFAPQTNSKISETYRICFAFRETIVILSFKLLETFTNFRQI